MRLWFERYLLPGFVFQSAIIAGAYSTGAEMLEFFFPFGSVGSFLAIGVVIVSFSVFSMISFELARRAKLYNYRDFMRHFIGRGWILFEALYILLMMLVLAVIGSASATIFSDLLGMNGLYGSLSLMAGIGLLVFYGTQQIERFLALWSFVLYAVYVAFFTSHFFYFGDEILATFDTLTINNGWAVSGFRYAGYVLVAVPIILFVVRHHTHAKHSIISGLLTGPIAMIPAVLFLAIMHGHGDAIAAANDIPLTLLINALPSASIFGVLFPIVLFGTFVETGAAFIHGLNERIDSLYQEKKQHMPQALRPSIALAILVFSITIATKVGLTDLVAKGYGIISYGFIVVLVLPVMTIGLWRFIKR